MAIRFAGIALIAGVVLAFVAPAFMPGYGLINPVDQTDFAAARDALGDSAVLAHWVNFITLLSLLLMIFAFLCLYPLASRQAGLGGQDTAVRHHCLHHRVGHTHHRHGHAALRDSPDAAQRPWRKRRSVACGVRGPRRSPYTST